MIRHLVHTDIDKAAWDRRLAACANGLWYAQSYVLDLASPGWEALMDEASGAIMPLTGRRKYGMGYLHQPLGLQQLGIFSPQPIPDAVCTAFLAAVPSRFRLVEIAGNSAMPKPTVHGWRSTEHRDQLLDLSSGIDHVRKRYAKGHLRNLASAAPSTAVATMPASAFAELYKATTGERFQGQDERGLEALGPLLEAARASGQCEVVGLKDEEGRWCAGVAMVHWQGRSILLKSAANDRARAMNGMFRLLDTVLERACARSTIMDFAGSEHEGTARFYEGFGAVPTVYLRLSRNTLPWYIKPFKR